MNVNNWNAIIKNIILTRLIIQRFMWVYNFQQHSLPNYLIVFKTLILTIHNFHILYI